MDNILQKEFLDNTIEAYLIVAGTVLFALLVKRILSKYLAGLLFRLFAKAGRKFNKQSFLNLILNPLETFLLVLVIVIACDKLTFPEILDFPVLHKISSRDVTEAIINGILVITFIRLCIRIIKFIALILGEKTDQSNNQFVIFFTDFFSVILVIFGGLLILRFSFNYKIGNLLTGLGLVGAAIALATKESLENLIASFIIFFDKPFFVGDTVKVGNFTGAIEKIGLRSTRIRTDQKTYITVPNKQMVDTIIDNVTMRTQRYAQLRLEISLSAAAEELQKIIAEVKIILQKDTVENASVLFSDTGKNAHIIIIEYFGSMQQTLTEFNALREKINFEIIELLNKNNIEFAAASTDVTVTQKQ